MKKVIAALLLTLGAALNVGAQGWQDAYSFSENNYVGTARSVGLGNAMTALGGDLGSLTFNPAGSAVASYSQFELTPGISMAITSAKGDPATGGYADAQTAVYTRFKMPNFGFMTNLDTKNNHGLKRLSFGFVGNATNDYTRQMRAAGTNDYSTLAGALASEASGWTTAEMTGGWYQDGAMPSWRAITSYYGGLIDPLTSIDGTYMGVTETLLDNGDITLTDPVYQQYGRRQFGNKYDILMNLAANFSDIFYVGANLGITTLSYQNEEYWIEAPDNTKVPFPVDYGDAQGNFEDLNLRYSYKASGSGIYFKTGFIVRPVAGLRIAAAIQTPTVLEIKERYGYDAQSSVSSLKRERTARTSEEGDWSYRLRSPMRVNAGLAYSFGNVAVLSADYEFVNQGRCRFKKAFFEDDVDFGSVNQDISDNLGGSHSLRVGAEVKPSSTLAFRLGYNYITGAEKGLVNEKGAKYVPVRHNASVGVGLSFGGSFFADFAARLSILPVEYLRPYSYYCWYYGFDGDSTEYSVANVLSVKDPEPSWAVQAIDDSVVTPRVAVRPLLLDVIATVGWRF